MTRVEGGGRRRPLWILLAVVVIAALVAGGLLLRPASTVDAAPASVLGWTPDVTSGVPLTAPLTVYFSRSMDQASVERAWRLTPRVPGRFVWTDNAVSFHPQPAFTAGSSYRLNLTSGARDDQGQPLQNSLRVDFITGNALKVSSVTPASGTGAAPVNGLVAVTFNHPMVALAGLSATTADPTGWRVSISPPTSGHSSWLGTSTWLFHPDHGLIPSSHYTVLLRGTAQDAWGQPLGHDLTWSFRTVTPGIIAENPAPGAHFANPAGAIRVTFNQPMNHSSAGLFSLRAAAPVPGATSWAGDTLVFQPAHPLDPAITYSAVVDGAMRAANGQATLGRTASWSFHVAHPPVVVSSTPANAATTANNYANIIFSSPMSQPSLDHHLTVSPPIQNMATSLSGTSNANTSLVYSINGQFEPSTKYSITIGAGALDIYGRALLAPYALTFTTAPMAPSVVLYGPPGRGPGVSFTAGQVVKAPVQAVNVTRVHYTLKRIALAALGSATGYGQTVEPPGVPVGSWTTPIPTQLNHVRNLSVPLASSAGTPLPPGLYWLGARGTSSVATASAGNFLQAGSEAVVAANTSVSMTQGAGQALVWVNSTASGKSLAGVHVALLDTNSHAVRSGRTDSSGLILFHVPANTFPTAAVVDDGGHFGLTTSNWSPEMRVPGTDPDLTGQYIPPPTGAYAYTDRPLYRPGQMVHFRAIIWRDRDGLYSHLGPRSVTANASDGQGHAVYHATLRLDRGGTVSGTFRLPVKAATGYSGVGVSQPGVPNGLGNVIAPFTIAEFRKPEFLTTVSADRSSYVQGQTIHATVRVRYVFDAPVAEQHVSWTAYTQPRLVQPSGWEGYQFGDQDAIQQQQQTPVRPGGEPRSQFGQVLTRGQGMTDARGELAIQAPFNLSHKLLDQTVTIEATTTDLNHQPVSGRAQVPTNHAALALGLAAQKQVVPVGGHETIDVVAVGINGAPAPRQALTARIYRRTYTSTLADNGFSQPIFQQAPHDSLMQSQTGATDSRGHAAFSFVPGAGGDYYVAVTGRDAAKNPALSALTVYASAAGFSDYGASSNSVISLQPDQPAYRVGQIAHILVAAPFNHASALVTVERGTLRSYYVRRLASNSVVIDVPVTSSDLPNVYVGVTIYRGFRHGSPPDWRYGLTELHVKLDSRKVIVRLTQNHAHYHPGDVVTYRVTTTDGSGHPAPAQLSLALVDSALLALQDESNASILRALYGDRQLEMFVSSDGAASIDHLPPQPNFVIRPAGGFGGGGGGPSGPTSFFDTHHAAKGPKVRHHFEDTAYWTANLVTDRSGHATVQVRLPDNLTTWRLDARAITAGYAVGQASLDTLSTQDVVLRPVVPRFFLQGDSVRLGAIVNNNLSQPVTTQVSLAASGLTVTSGGAQSVTVPAHGERLVTWQARVPEGSSVRLTLTATPSTAGVKGDAVRLTLPVHSPLTAETVSVAGQVFSSIKQYVIAPAGAASSPGALTVQVSSALTAGIGRALADLQPAPYESNEDLAARVLAAGSLRTLPAAITGLAPAQQRGPIVARDAGDAKLLSRQLADGGWPWFNGPAAHSDPLITADVVQALSESGAPGLGRAIERAQSYLRGVAAIPYGQSPTTPSTLTPDQRAHLMWIVVEPGNDGNGGVQGSLSAAEALYTGAAQQARLGPSGLADLARTLHALGDTARARSLIAQLDAAAVVSATGARWEASFAGSFQDSAVSATSRVLAALLTVAPHDAFVPAAARWLMLARQGNGWESPRDTAQAVAVLSAYAHTASEGRANYRYRVTVDNHQALSGDYSPRSSTRSASAALTVSMLKRGSRSTLLIERLPVNGTVGTGPMYYVAQLRYFLPAARIQPRNAGIAVSRRYLDLRGQPIRSAPAGSVLRVELTIRAPQTLAYLDLEDPLPSGFEPLDQSLNTTQRGLAATPSPPPGVAELQPYLDHTDLRDDRISLYASSLPAGTYTYTYLAQATLAGSYAVAPTHAAEVFFPEVFGRSAGTKFTVR
ncbi:MAG: Ig-like domain-containing protein [Chloroflexota bacterium]|nr:Ig-like domain-containing protein [Chloroflexota bacterium]